MTDRSVPILFGGEYYHLRFERKDIRDIERAHAPLLMLLQPSKFGWDTAAIILHKGLKRETETGELVYAFPQTVEGEDQVFEKCKEFTNQFTGVSVGLSVLYGIINSGMVVSGWFQAKKGEKKDSQVVDPAKNSQKPKGRKKKSLSASAGSHPEN